MHIYRLFFNKVDAFTALCFTGTGAPLTVGRMRILLIAFGINGMEVLTLNKCVA
jgi:hypothetical protein